MASNVAVNAVVTASTKIVAAPAATLTHGDAATQTFNFVNSSTGARTALGDTATVKLSLTGWGSASGGVNQPRLRNWRDHRRLQS
ncbi:MAG: hypothetical protein KAY82_03075 [Hylemonella sp.]|nr:hypothetical protein [Hylemonella sp.]